MMIKLGFNVHIYIEVYLDAGRKERELCALHC